MATDPVPAAGRSLDYFLLRGAVRIESEERTRRYEMFGKFPGETEMFGKFPGETEMFATVL